MMLTGTVLTANAQEHEHAFSYVGDYEVGFTVIQTHPYLVNDGNGNMATKQCEVRLYKYQKVYKCGCGMVSEVAPKAVIRTAFPPIFREFPSISLNITPSLLDKIGLPPVT